MPNIFDDVGALEIDLAEPKPAAPKPEPHRGELVPYRGGYLALELGLNGEITVRAFDEDKVHHMGSYVLGILPSGKVARYSGIGDHLFEVNLMRKVRMAGEE